jgi:hypothetical protein
MIVNTQNGCNIFLSYGWKLCVGFCSSMGLLCFLSQIERLHKMGIPMFHGDSLVAEEIMHLCPSYEPITLCLTKAVVVSSHVLG